MLRRIILFLVASSLAWISGARDGRADLLVADNFGHQVLRYSETSGAFLGTLVSSQSGGLSGAVGLRIGPDGNLWVTSQNTNEIKRYNAASGAFIDNFASPASSGGALAGPSDLRFGPDGNLYVTNFFGTSVDRYNPATGQFIDRWATGGGQNGSTYIVWGPDNNAYVSSFNTNKVLRYNGTTGAFIDEFAAGGGLNGPAGLAFHNGVLYVSSLFTQQVLKYDAGTKAFLGVFATIPPKSAAQAFPADLMIRPDQSLLVSYTGQSGIGRYALDGTNLGIFASGGGLQVPGQMLIADAVPVFEWVSDSDGPWSAGARWSQSVAPSGKGVSVKLGAAISASRQIALADTRTLGQLSIDNVNAYSIAGPGTLVFDDAAPAANVAAGTHTIAAGVRIAAGTTLRKTGLGTLILAGQQLHESGAQLSVAGGAVELRQNGGANLAIAVAGTNSLLRAAAPQTVRSIEVSDGGALNVVPGGGNSISTNGLAISTGGELDLADGELALHAAAASRLAAAAAVAGWVKTGFANFTWSGPGINSSAAFSDESQLTAVGVMLNDDGLGGPYRSQFAGGPVDENTVLVKYTYFGDADLSGAVDGTDYALIDNGFNAGLIGWFNGDFDYSGTIDGTDYALIDNAFNGQGAPLAATAVPEPAGLLLALTSLGAVGYAQVAKRRRRSRHCLTSAQSMRRAAATLSCEFARQRPE